MQQQVDRVTDLVLAAIGGLDQMTGVEDHGRERVCLGDEPTPLPEILDQVEVSERRVRYALVYLEDRDVIERNPTEVSYRMVPRTGTR